MALTSVTEKYCRWLSLKFFVILIGIWGLFVGVLTFFNSMVFSIMIMQKKRNDITHTIYDVYGAIHIMLYEFTIAMIMIFSCYLLYGTIREFPGKSTYVFAWLVLACVSDVLTLVDLIMTAIEIPQFFKRHFPEELILLCTQFICIAIVYSYYRTLPKRQFNTT